MILPYDAVTCLAPVDMYVENDLVGHWMLFSRPVKKLITGPYRIYRKLGIKLTLIGQFETSGKLEGDLAEVCA